MRAVLIPLAAAALLAGCNRTDTLGEDRPPQTPAPDAPAPAIVSSDAGSTEQPGDPNSVGGFVARIAQSDLFEVEASRLALQRTTSAPVRAFAQSMIDAHTRSSQELRAQLTAARLEVTPPVDLDRAGSDRSADLRSVAADGFDALYLRQQVEGHTATLALLQAYGRNGDNAALRTWAGRQAQMVEQHLATARALAGGQTPPAAAGADASAGAASGSGATPETAAPSTATSGTAPAATTPAPPAATPAPAPRR